MTLRQGLQDFRRRHRDSSFLLPSPLIADRGANKNVRLKGSDRPPRHRALHASRWPALGSAQFAKQDMASDVAAVAARFSFRREEAIRLILSNAQSRSSSTIIRSMFVSFLAILNNASRNGSEVVCCALMPKAV